MRISLFFYVALIPIPCGCHSWKVTHLVELLDGLVHVAVEEEQVVVLPVVARLRPWAGPILPRRSLARFVQRCTSVQERKCPRQWVAVQTLFGEDGVPVLHEEEVDRLNRRQESVVLQRMRTQKLRSQKAAKRWKNLKAVEQMDGNARANPLKTHELHSWLAPHTTSITNNLRLHTLHMAPTPSSGTSRK